MNLPKSPMRRVAAIAAGALIGLTGAATFAGPASAHHTTISGTACLTTNGVHRVEWKVVNSERDLEAKISEVWTPSGTTINGIAKGTKIAANGKVSGTQLTTKGSALELKVTAKWMRNGQEITHIASGTAKLSTNCTTPPTATPTPTKPTTTPTVKPSATPSVTPSATPSATASVTPSATPTTTPSTPVPTSPVPTTQPSEPTGPLVPEEPNAPVFEIVFDCDELVITADNPADGITETVVLTSEKNVVKKLELVPGKKTEVSFEAYEGLTVTPSVDGEQADPADAVKWVKPANCTPGQGGGDNDGPALPLTGAATGGIIAGAAVLLAVGAGLFVMARRRKVRFTA
ncbi:LPXTG cell wall anchor domain-containing protein [Micromonospora sp. NPDC049204]|uniref:LPXTG cell wall anchor domain-containing protein n=1 Tax=Micromonospora sp. NPDC049204 TaxID=3154351 RepID=UPI0033D01F78